MSCITLLCITGRALCWTQCIDAAEKTVHSSVACGCQSGIISYFYGLIGNMMMMIISYFHVCCTLSFLSSQSPSLEPPLILSGADFRLYPFRVDLQGYYPSLDRVGGHSRPLEVELAACWWLVATCSVCLC
jgi:hypothetical protein